MQHGPLTTKTETAINQTLNPYSNPTPYPPQVCIGGNFVRCKSSHVGQSGWNGDVSWITDGASTLPLENHVGFDVCVTRMRMFVAPLTRLRAVSFEACSKFPPRKTRRPSCASTWMRWTPAALGRQLCRACAPGCRGSSCFCCDNLSFRTLFVSRDTFVQVPSLHHRPQRRRRPRALQRLGLPGNHFNTNIRPHFNATNRFHLNDSNCVPPPPPSQPPNPSTTKTSPLQAYPPAPAPAPPTPPPAPPATRATMLCAPPPAAPASNGT